MRKRKEKHPPRPTDVELSILRVLWQHGPGSVREVLAQFNESRQTEAGYTTILKMLQIMADKGLVERDDSRRPQVYRARLTQEQTQRQLVSDLLDKAFGGSAKQLVMQALSAREASEEELGQVERLLDKLEGGSK
ncbi:MAG TPA: BlaI/MecI/CopY family transcriptional regulator [Pyrinomonadaceae bacterium]|jgi:predicted transcriptional regulator|nr:BlaI/MecI/CopY family transcriptional regulator [Pyrinomonadaceae bacterium]